MEHLHILVDVEGVVSQSKYDNEINYIDPFHGLKDMLHAATTGDGQCLGATQ